MAVINFQCAKCNKFLVCKWADTIKKFSEDYSKNPIDVEIEMKNCPEFKTT